MSLGKEQSESMYTPAHLEDQYMSGAKHVGKKSEKLPPWDQSAQKNLRKINTGPCKTYKNLSNNEETLQTKCEWIPFFNND